MSRLILPRVEIPTPRQVLDLNLGEGHLTDYGRWLLFERVPMMGGASFSDYAENKILDHAYGKTSWTMPTTMALALCTVVPTDSSTGATITEATAATGYARKVFVGTDLAAAASGEIHNSAVLTFAAITAGSATVIGAAACDSSTTGAGNIIAWFTCASTVISSTQTPPTIAASAMSNTLD